MAAMDGFHVQTITFGTTAVEITYSEERDQSVHIAQVRTLAVSIDAVAEEYEELLEAAEAVVDAALLIHRSPIGVSGGGTTGRAGVERPADE